MGGEPTLGGGVLAVLFFRAILRHDEFRLERHNLVVTGSDQGRPQHGMEILLAGFAAQSRRAVRTMDGLGTEIFGAIECDQTVCPFPWRGDSPSMLARGLPGCWAEPQTRRVSHE